MLNLPHHIEIAAGGFVLFASGMWINIRPNKSAFGTTIGFAACLFAGLLISMSIGTL